VNKMSEDNTPSEGTLQLARALERVLKPETAAAARSEAAAEVSTGDETPGQRYVRQTAEAAQVPEPLQAPGLPKPGQRLTSEGLAALHGDIPALIAYEDAGGAEELRRVQLEESKGRRVV
jgi:hypothetical protein